MANQPWYFDAELIDVHAAVRLHAAAHVGDDDGVEVVAPGPRSLQYVVRAIVRHVHSGKTNLTRSSGHYVTYFRQKDTWYCDKSQSLCFLQPANALKAVPSAAS